MPIEHQPNCNISEKLEGDCSCMVVCPFCGEGDFDKEGLKGHLQHEDCDEYKNLTAPRRLFS